MGGIKHTHCRQGHEFTEENTYIVPSTGVHLCRICKTLRQPSIRPRLSILEPKPRELKTHCKHGHEYSEENTRIRVINGRDIRECITCKRIRNDAPIKNPGAGSANFQGSKTHCPKGHLYDEENTCPIRIKGVIIGRGCRVCARYKASKMRNTYRFGISKEETEIMKRMQEYKCAICGTHESEMITKIKLCVDHDHITKKVREMLCPTCNTGLGFFKENINSLKSAINYLEFHNG